jgi:hypothetical protein
MFVSGSKDSTLKVWTMKNKKMMFDLPGHSDEVSNEYSSAKVLRSSALTGAQMERKLPLEVKIE